jgi:hypothetical protein
MTKSSQEKCYKRGLYRDNGKDENNNFFCGEYLLDYKMAISNHTLGDYITIKSIIETLVIYTIDP